MNEAKRECCHNWKHDGMSCEEYEDRVQSGASPAHDPYEVRLIARLDVKPGDVVVLTCPHRIADTQKTAIETRFRAVMPDTVRVVLLDQGMGLAVISPQIAKTGLFP